MISEFNGEYRFLSNFYPSKIIYDGIEYPSVEYAFQALKTFDIEMRKTISKLSTPGIAKRYGKILILRDDWEDVKFQIMENCLRLKFHNGSELAKKLVDTYPSNLVEGNVWHDNIWGSCSCKKCLQLPSFNNLGKLLMKIREELVPEENRLI